MRNRSARTRLECFRYAESKLSSLLQDRSFPAPQARERYSRSLCARDHELPTLHCLSQACELQVRFGRSRTFIFGYRLKFYSIKLADWKTSRSFNTLWLLYTDTPWPSNRTYRSILICFKVDGLLDNLLAQILNKKRKNWESCYHNNVV